MSTALPPSGQYVPGDRIIIYYDPYARESREGTATLLGWEYAEADGAETWKVQFDNELEIFSRLVVPPSRAIPIDDNQSAMEGS